MKWGNSGVLGRLYLCKHPLVCSFCCCFSFPFPWCWARREAGALAPVLGDECCLQCSIPHSSSAPCGIVAVGVWSSLEAVFSLPKAEGCSWPCPYCHPAMLPKDGCENHSPGEEGKKLLTQPRMRGLIRLKGQQRFSWAFSISKPRIWEFDLQISIKTLF